QGPRELSVRPPHGRRRHLAGVSGRMLRARQAVSGSLRQHLSDLRPGGRRVTLGIMQPYFFSYIGYFQLLAAVDRFVVYDDVTFIKQGWINRNRMLINGDASFFTIPLAHKSSGV